MEIVLELIGRVAAVPEPVRRAAVAAVVAAVVVAEAEAVVAVVEAAVAAATADPADSSSEFTLYQYLARHLRHAEYHSAHRPALPLGTDFQTRDTSVSGTRLA